MPIDFTLTQEQRKLQAEARAFAEKELSGVAEAIRNLQTPRERFMATRPFYEQAVKQGWMRKMLPVAVGGENKSLVDAALIAEEFYAVDPNVSLTIFANLLGLLPVLSAGSSEQIQKAAAPFLSGTGTPLAAFCHSEPGGTANFAAAPPAEGSKTRAVLDGDEWVINGSKQWVSNATGWESEGADVMAVVCRTATGDDTSPEESFSVILVTDAKNGLVWDEDFDTLGHRGHLTPRFHFENLRVPKENLIGPIGAGKSLVEASFTGTAALAGALGVGLMRAAFDFTLNFAKTEKRGGAVPIIEHQAVGYALGEAKTSLEAARYLCWKACNALDNNQPGALELALQSKIYCTETAVRVITDLMRLVGIDSYNHNLPLARILQDAIALPLFDGGNMGVRRRQLHELMLTDGYHSQTAPYA